MTLGQTIGILQPGEGAFLVLLFNGFENLLDHPFFLICQWSASFPRTFKPLKSRIIHMPTLLKT